MSCSQRKHPTAGLMPAIERYDGPAFLVLRRYLRECGDPNTVAGGAGLRVLILSAEFGLIPARRRIPFYDRRMDRHRAEALRPRASAALRAAVRRWGCGEVFVCAGSVYLHALGPAELCPAPLAVAAGGQGGKLTALRDWLRAGPRRPQAEGGA